MKIVKLALRNFKGIKSFDLEAQGKNIEIYGRNETGKTTIFDAFLWLFFDKDSLNQKDFEIKPLTASGEPIHGIESIVEATISTEEGDYTLKKVYYEKWVKQRGSAEKTFSGHTTDYYIDGVPRQKKDFTDFISNLIDESIFKLLTNPLYFNEQMHWTDRRNLLLEVCGNVSVDDVVTEEPKLEELRSILGRRSLEDHRKVIAAKRREINEKLERIPVRIDEVKRGMSDIEGIDFDAIEHNIGSCRKEQEEIRQKISRIRGETEVSQKKKELAELEAELINMKSEYDRKHMVVLKEANSKAIETYQKYNKIGQEIADAENSRDDVKRQMRNLESLVVRLRDEWHTADEREFTISQESVCPTCGQDIPESQLQETREKALAEFNLKKSNGLEAINKEGKEVASDLEKLNVSIVKHESKVSELRDKQAKISKEFDEANERIRTLNSQKPDYEKNAEYKQKIKLKEQILAEIDLLQSESASVIVEHEQSIRTFERAIQHYQEELSKKSQHENGKVRIEELQKEERDLAREFEGLDRELNLTDLYIQTQVKLLEDKINNRFGMARFKLFNVLQHGGIEECCECTNNGVPYNSVNHGAKINLGLDIINTLSEFYNFTAPVFIDNAEAVTELISLKAQAIKLYVSKADKKLRIELEEEVSDND